METQRIQTATRWLQRGAAAVLVTVGLTGCVYAPPYAYDPYYPGYSYPTYVAPPISVDLGFGYVGHRHHGHYGGHGRGHGHGHGHGWGRR